MLSFFLTAPCCWKRHFVRWIFDLGAKEGDKAGSNWPPAYDLVPFKVELTPNHLISFLENTSSRSTCKICLHACAEWELSSSKISREKRSWSCKTSFLDMIVAKFSTKGIWSMCVDPNPSISVWRPLKKPVRGRVGVLSWQRSRYADWWIWIHQSRELEGLLLVKGTEKKGLAQGTIFRDWNIWTCLWKTQSWQLQKCKKYYLIGARGLRLPVWLLHYFQLVTNRPP